MNQIMPTTAACFNGPAPMVEQEADTMKLPKYLFTKTAGPKAAYWVRFVHPVYGDRQKRPTGMLVTDLTRARQFSTALDRFITEPEFHDIKRKPAAQAIDPIAAAIFYKTANTNAEVFIDNAINQTLKITLPPLDEGEIEQELLHEDAITVLLEKLRTERIERIVLEEKLAELHLLRAEIAELRQRAGIVLTEKTFADALSDFEAWGCRCGGRGGRPWSPVHERQMKNRMVWWVGKLKSCPLAEIKLSDVQVALATIQGAPKTKHDYAMTLTTFLNWCRKNDLLGFDPLKHLGKLDKQAVEDWRALSLNEVKSLLAAAPADRGIIYALSATTGLRIGEIGALKVKHLDMINGCLRPATDDMKNRKKTVLPVPKSVMERLIALAKGKPGEELLLPIHHNYGKDFTVDLEAAGIAYETPEGKAVVHSLRKSFTTLVQELSGASLSEAQKLSRHSTPTLTSNLYTKTAGKRLLALVDNLGERLLA